MLKVTRIKIYQTEFGPFKIQTSEGKVRRRNMNTGKVEWRQSKTTDGFFEEWPNAIYFFIERDGQNRCVASLQGEDSYEWIKAIHAKNYDDALRKTNDAVVKAFRDYYDDDSII